MKLAISPELQLPIEAVTETFGILAVKRAGKSNAAVVMAEEMFRAGLPWVAIDPKGDWWGIRSSSDGSGPGLPILVLGGLHADVPLEATAGHLVADLVVDQRLTCVLDVSEMSKADQRRFLADFAERLYKRNREPLHVFCEEADEYIPQMVRGDIARLVGAFEQLVKRGGFRGLGITLITQRSASLNKDVLTQVQTLFAMRTTSPQDRKAILGWVVQHVGGPEMVDELPELDSGDAWVFSPHWLGQLVKIRFRRRQTFDSGATPKVGVKTRPQVTVAEVDIAALREKMAATIEKAKADDPRELRKRIKDLERDAQLLLIQQQQAAKPQVEVRESIVEWIERVPIGAEEIPHLRDLAGRLGEVAKELALIAQSLDHNRSAVIKSNSAQLKGRAAQLAVGASAGVRVTTPAPRPASQARPVPPAASVSNGKVSGPQQRLLDAMARLEAARVLEPTRTQAAALAGVSPKSSGFEKNVSTLSTLSLIRYPGPGRVALTEDGRSHAAAVGDPPTVEEFQEYICRLVSGPQATLLRCLIASYPKALSRADLAEACSVSALSSGFEKNVSTLSSFGFVRYPERGFVAADPLVFLEDR